MTHIYKNMAAMMDEVDYRSERVTGTTQGVIIDTITGQSLGRWKYIDTDGTVEVIWS